MGVEGLQTVAGGVDDRQSQLALALVIAQQSGVGHARQATLTLALAQHMGQTGHIVQAQVQAQTSQGVNGVRGVAHQHKRRSVGCDAAPMPGLRRLQRPDRPTADQAERAQFAGGLLHQHRLEQGCVLLAASLGQWRRQGPNHSAVVGVAQRQLRQDGGLRTGPHEPLARALAMGPLVAHPKGQRVLIVGLALKRQPPSLAAAAGFAFADHGQFGMGCRGQQGDAGFVGHALAQQGQQRRDVHDPAQRLTGGAFKVDLTTVVAPHGHALHRRGRRFGPGTQAFQQLARRGIERIGPHIRLTRRGWGRDQRDPQALSGQGQRLGATGDAVASDANVKIKRHGLILGLGHPVPQSLRQSPHEHRSHPF